MKLTGYRSQAFSNETRRIKFLFKLYEQYTIPLMASTGIAGKKSGRLADSVQFMPAYSTYPAGLN